MAAGQATADLLSIWWERHGDQPVAVRQLHVDVKHAADPQDRGRQYLASQLEKLAGTRVAGSSYLRVKRRPESGAPRRMRLKRLKLP
jgi:hypothetical protein